MSLFNNQLKKVKLTELLILIIFLFLIQIIINTSNIIYLDSSWIYFAVILYFIFKLKSSLYSIKNDFKEVFQHYKVIIFVVILNIFVSYGFLYLSDFILGISRQNTYLLTNSAFYMTLFSTIFISPICEELIFRGVFLNRLKLAVPLIFSILISSLIFAALHTFGSITSAFIFALSMAILYIKTDNILVPITAHFLNNLFAEIIVMLDSGNILFTHTTVIHVMGILSIISFIILVSWIVKQLNL